MTIKQYDNRMRKIEELEAKKAELEKEIEGLKNEIKDSLGDEEHIETPNYKINWVNVISNSFDSKSFKASHAKLYESFLVPKASRRFTYAVLN